MLVICLALPCLLHLLATAMLYSMHNVWYDECFMVYCNLLLQLSICMACKQTEKSFCMPYIENALYRVVLEHSSSLDTFIGHTHVVMQQITMSSHSHTLTHTHIHCTIPCITHTHTHTYTCNYKHTYLYRLLTWCYYWNWLNETLSAFIVLYSIYSPL